jgi:di/tricarboxylate transporter
MDILGFLDTSWYQQTAILLLLATGLIMFIRDRFRYDVVALFLMIAVIVLGIIPYEDALANFGHPAVVIVAAMFIMSNALVYSGIIDLIVSRISFLHHQPVLSLFCLIVLVAAVSGFVNNIGALAMVMPIALHLAHKSNTPIAFYLLPIAFASHLGGYLTLIGTPRNILISNYREEATGVPFSMFDFTYIGGAIAIAGIIFITLYAWKFFPRKSIQGHNVPIVREYLTEVSLTKGAKVLNLSVAKFHAKTKDQVTLVTIFRNNTPLAFSETTTMHEDDVLCLRGTEEALTLFIEKFKLQLVGLRALEKHVTNADDYISLEVVVPPYSKISNRSWDEIRLQDRFGTNFIGLFRRTFTPTVPLAQSKIHGNDILLLQGRTESVMSTVNAFSLLPLANSTAHLGRTTTILATLTIVVGAIMVATFAIIPLPIVFLLAVSLLIGFNLISLRAAYDSIDWPVLVLIAGMITLGDALVASGGAESLSRGVLALSETLSPVAILVVVLVASMLMSDFINTTASAVIMGPIAILIATGIGVSVDPFLIAVAIGASSAFLTPVGHESNALVMQKGGYRFSDFTKIGLPLELIIIAISIPLILIVWPL